MWVDKGCEFYNKDVKKLVGLYSTENEEKSCVIERLNSTLKEKYSSISLLIIQENFVDVLDLLVDQYNNAIHSSIKMTPNEASYKENENKVWINLYPELGGKTFSVGDNVRITKKKKTFDKGYTQRWTKEVFIIYKILLTIPVTYKSN